MPQRTATKQQETGAPARMRIRQEHHARMPERRRGVQKVRTTPAPERKQYRVHHAPRSTSHLPVSYPHQSVPPTSPHTSVYQCRQTCPPLPLTRVAGGGRGGRDALWGLLSDQNLHLPTCTIEIPANVRRRDHEGETQPETPVQSAARLAQTQSLDYADNPPSVKRHLDFSDHELGCYPLLGVVLDHVVAH